MGPLSRLLPARRVAAFKQDVWSIFSPLSVEVNAVNLGQGFMDFPPPAFVKKAAAECSVRDDCAQYSHPKGRPRLRKALAEVYGRSIGRKLDAETEVVVTAGANEGILSVLSAYVDPGDEVILFEPYFDQYHSNITMNGGVPVFCPLRVRSGADAGEIMSSADWVIHMDELRSKITPRTRVMILNTPHNPVGKVMSDPELREIASVAKENDILVISDEVYDRLVFKPHRHLHLASVPGMWERTITVGSGGKSFGVTGWRVGWIIGPTALLSHALAAHTRIVFAVNSPCQEAVAISLEEAVATGYFDKQVEEYTHRRKLFLRALDRVGLKYTVPDGSYFVLVNTSRIKVPQGYPFPEIVAERGEDYKVCYWLTKEIGVTAIPPSEFYSSTNAHLAASYARFAFCKKEETLLQAGERLMKLRDYLSDQ